jgi:hypothetical protein
MAECDRHAVKSRPLYCTIEAMWMFAGAVAHETDEAIRSVSFTSSSKSKTVAKAVVHFSNMR